jgi:hypothetical protein
VRFEKDLKPCRTILLILVTAKLYQPFINP